MTRQQPGKHSPDDRPSEPDPDTALGEALKEFEDAETRDPGHTRKDPHDGEAGDALTPNEEAQEEATGH
ncbi:hypothetical protein ACFVYD_27090 [Streptomyces sp. NPDC058301]|uniref:hypothetical protein n=1 Tax=Streptomyces sp. NPDC058301 TaxID=3346436 RepID=UPI0036E829C2